MALGVEPSSLEGVENWEEVLANLPAWTGEENKVNGKACAQQCCTPAVILGAAPPRPKLGKGRRIMVVDMMSNLCSSEIGCNLRRGLLSNYPETHWQVQVRAVGRARLKGLTEEARPWKPWKLWKPWKPRSWKICSVQIGSQPEISSLNGRLYPLWTGGWRLWRSNILE